MQTLRRALPNLLFHSPSRKLFQTTFPKSMSTFKPQIDPSFKIREMDLEDFELVLKWAIEQDWIFCKGDGKIIYQPKPNGLYIGEVNGKPMCSYVCIRHGDCSFLSLHFVNKEYQGKGYGTMIEDHARAFYKDCKTFVFEAEGKNRQRYERLGFTLLTEVMTLSKKAEGRMSSDLVDLRTVPIDELARYDLEVFGYPRKEYLEAMIKEEHNKSLGSIKNGKLTGFGVLKERVDGSEYIISPLQADDVETADKILSGLQSFVVGKDVCTGIFGVNPNAVEVYKLQGWHHWRNYAKMYGGEKPRTDLNRLYVPCYY